MKKNKIIIVSVLSTCFIGIANAQNNKPQGGNQQPTTIANAQIALQKSNTLIECDVKPDLRKTELDLNKVLKKEVTKDSTIIIVTDKETLSLSIDSAKVDFAEIKEKLSKINYNLLVKEKKSIAVEEKSQIYAERYDPEIDRFINSEDISVLKDKFMDLSENQIHPRSWLYYNLLKKIRTLDIWVTNPNLQTIRPDLDKMGKLIDEINDPAISPKSDLPKPLLDYFKSLAKKYFEIYEQIYPNE